MISSVSPAHNVTQQLRSRLELRCAAAGNPAPRYSWVHHSEAGSEVRGHEAVWDGLRWASVGPLPSTRKFSAHLFTVDPAH